MSAASSPLLVLGTTNAGKLRELVALLEPFAIPCRSLREMPGAVEGEETGATFAENAARKATQQATAWGLEGVPGLGVNGRWYTAPSMARGNAQALQVVDWLLDQERKARK